MMLKYTTKERDYHDTHYCELVIKFSDCLSPLFNTVARKPALQQDVHA